MIDLSQTNAVGLPDKYIPTLPAVIGSGDVLRFHILPGNKTGVVRRQRVIYPLTADAISRYLLARSHLKASVISKPVLRRVLLPSKRLASQD